MSVSPVDDLDVVGQRPRRCAAGPSATSSPSATLDVDGVVHALGTEHRRRPSPDPRARTSPRRSRRCCPVRRCPTSVNVCRPVAVTTSTRSPISRSCCRRWPCRRPPVGSRRRPRRRRSRIVLSASVPSHEAPNIGAPPVVTASPSLSMIWAVRCSTPSASATPGNGGDGVDAASAGTGSRVRRVAVVAEGEGRADLRGRSWRRRR